MERVLAKWTYKRLNHSVGVETSEWLGANSPTLAAHLHDEIQISIVHEGHRVFQIGQHNFHVPAGEFVVIPAGIPHRSHGLEGVPTKSRDIFIDPTCELIDDQSSVLIGSISDIFNFDDSAAIDDVLHKMNLNKVSKLKLKLPNSLSCDLKNAVQESDLSVAELAACKSFSREGFIRRFARETGMTPHAYRLAYRTTQARSCLRGGLLPAAAAHECGFADQSHLGRMFKRNFGTTPAAYKKVWQY